MGLIVWYESPSDRENYHGKALIVEYNKKSNHFKYYEKGFNISLTSKSKLRWQKPLINFCDDKIYFIMYCLLPTNITGDDLYKWFAFDINNGYFSNEQSSYNLPCDISVNNSALLMYNRYWRSKVEFNCFKNSHFYCFNYRLFMTSNY